jgi:hypothetical protein
MPVTLPPIRYRPGERPTLYQPPNNTDRADRPAHLPPRPQESWGGDRGERGGGHDQGLNYG